MDAHLANPIRRSRNPCFCRLREFPVSVVPIPFKSGWITFCTKCGCFCWGDAGGTHTRTYCGRTNSISHHVETIVCWHLEGNRPKPGVSWVVRTGFRPSVGSPGFLGGGSMASVDGTEPLGGILSDHHEHRQRRDRV